jgi:hypothetical protein
MKRGILFFIFSAFIFITAYSQSLSLIRGGVALTNEQALVYVNSDASAINNCEDIVCYNHTSDSIHVKVRKKVISITAGTQNYFCWGNCFLPSVFVSPNPVTIFAGDTTDLLIFSCHYMPNDNYGSSTIMYTFFNEANVNDSICVQITFDCPEGIQNIAKNEIEFSNAYPNPAADYTSFTYSLPVSYTGEYMFIMRDMVGNVVSETPITDKTGTIKMETDHLGNGVYFYSLLVDKTPYLTRKLIIKH